MILSDCKNEIKSKCVIKCDHRCMECLLTNTLYLYIRCVIQRIKHQMVVF